jgi:hypothetical protein
MANKRLQANKEQESGTTTGWRYLYNLCSPGSAVSAEVLSGESNGANTVFKAAKGDWLKSDGNTAVVADVKAYVDAVEVTVASIDAEAGTYTLNAAPAGGTVVTGDYTPMSKCHHVEVFIKAEDMTDPESASEAVIAADAEAATARTTWVAALAAAPVLSSEAGHLGDVSL